MCMYRNDKVPITYFFFHKISGLQISFSKSYVFKGIFARVTDSNIYMKKHRTNSKQHNPEEGEYAGLALSNVRPTIKLYTI